jgi:hypothetical protein
MNTMSEVINTIIDDFSSKEENDKEVLDELNKIGSCCQLIENTIYDETNDNKEYIHNILDKFISEKFITNIMKYDSVKKYFLLTGFPMITDWIASSEARHYFGGFNKIRESIIEVTAKNIMDII